MSSSAGLSAILCSCAAVAAMVVTAGRSISWARPPATDSGQEVSKTVGHDQEFTAINPMRFVLAQYVPQRQLPSSVLCPSP
jgi:hypothetical protein